MAFLGNYARGDRVIAPWFVNDTSGSASDIDSGTLTDATKVYEPNSPPSIANGTSQSPADGLPDVTKLDDANTLGLYYSEFTIGTDAPLGTYIWLFNEGATPGLTIDSQTPQAGHVFQVVEWDTDYFNADSWDKFLNRDLGSVTIDDITDRTLIRALARLLNKVSSSGATQTIYQYDDSTTFFTCTLTTDASANPITDIDPS